MTAESGLTESLCPECLDRLPARYQTRGGEVYLVKTCPRHGRFETVVWRGQPDYAGWERPAQQPASPTAPRTGVEQGCPYDCGLCPQHRQQPCCVLLEVTQRCDLGCPVCFAAAGSGAADPDLETIAAWMRGLLAAGGPFNIQLSGGEPCLRDDLPEIIALGRSLGFTFFQVNTNGLRLARDPDYLKRLKEAGLSTVYLQFDGVSDTVYEKIRGRGLLDLKTAVIEHCAAMRIGLVLVPTIVPGVNDHQIGDILRFALQHHPGVRGVHYQPVSYFGRYPGSPADRDRITLPEIITRLEQQSGGLVRAASFKPPNAENAHCSFHGSFVVMPDGQLKPLTRRSSAQSCCQPARAGEGRARAQQFVAQTWAAAAEPAAPDPGGYSLGEWDTFLVRARTHILAVSGMAFQDAWTVDLERLRDCYILTVAPDGRLVPFCAYNLTSRGGRGLYRGVC